ASRGRNGRDIDSDHVVENGTVDKAGGADTGRSKFDGARVALDVVDKSIEPINKQIAARDQNCRLVRNQHYGGKIVLKIVDRMLVERHVDGIRAAAEDERVAIGRRLRDMGGTEHSASASDVFNDDLLPHD